MFGEARLNGEVAIPPKGELTWTIPPGELTKPDPTLGEPVTPRPTWIGSAFSAPWGSGKERGGQEEPRI